MFEDKFIIIHSFFFIIYIFSKNFILQIILIWYGHNKYKIHNIKILFRIAIRHLWISKKTKCRVYDYQKVACRIRRISDVRQLAIVRWRNDLINLGGRRTGGDLDLAVLSPPFRFLTWPLFLLSVRRRFGSFPPALATSIKTKARYFRAGYRVWRYLFAQRGRFCSETKIGLEEKCDNFYWLLLDVIHILLI